VIDSSVLLEMAYATELGKAMATSLLEGKIKAWTTKLALTETLYIICRILGEVDAEKKTIAVINSMLVGIYDSESLHLGAGRIKCKRSISLADSYVIASAMELDFKALFARREKEIISEMQKEKFESPVLFLEDFV
jgi:predicted nucleic acid-binding protein